MFSAYSLIPPKSFLPNYSLAGFIFNGLISIKHIYSHLDTCVILWCIILSGRCPTSTVRDFALSQPTTNAFFSQPFRANIECYTVTHMVVVSKFDETQISSYDWWKWWQISPDTNDTNDTNSNNASYMNHQIQHLPAEKLESLLFAFYNKIKEDLPPVLFLPLPEPSILVVLTAVITVVSILTLFAFVLKICAKHGLDILQRRRTEQIRLSSFASRGRTPEPDSERGNTGSQPITSINQHLSTSGDPAGDGWERHPAGWRTPEEHRATARAAAAAAAAAAPSTAAAATSSGTGRQTQDDAERFLDDDYEHPADTLSTSGDILPPYPGAVNTARSLSSAPIYTRAAP